MTRRWDGLTPTEIGARESEAWQEDVAATGAQLGRVRGPVNPARLVDVPHTRFEGPVFQVRRRTPAQLTTPDGVRHDVMVEGLRPVAGGGRVLVLSGPGDQAWACVRADQRPWPAEGDHAVEVREPDLRLAGWPVPAAVVDRVDDEVALETPTATWAVRTTAIGVDDDEEARLRAEGYAARAREREAGLRYNGDIADYRGRLFRVLSADEAQVRLPRGHADHDEFPDAVEFGRGPHGPWVALPRQAVGRLFHRTVAARWHDEPVSVRGPVRDGHVFVDFHGTPERARELAAEGDADSGWYLRVPVSELHDIHDEDTP